MSLNWFSLICLALVIALGVYKKINIGIIAIGAAFLLGKLGGLTDAVIMGGFGSSLFLMLVGVMYLFSIAQINGTMELFARKIIALAGKQTKLIPIIIFIVSIFISAVGPGALPGLIIMSAFSLSLASEMKVSPLLMASMGFFGTTIGGVSPIAANGIIIQTIASKQGIHDLGMALIGPNSIATTTIVVILYIVLKGYKINVVSPFKGNDLPKFNKEQVLTLIGLVIMMIIVFTFKFNVGLVSLVIGTILILFKVANEKEVLGVISWGTLILVTGVGVLMSVIGQFGGIKLLANILASAMNPITAPAVMSFTCSILAFFTSVSGVVLPTMVATVPDIVKSVAVNPKLIISAISAGAHVGGISPITGGAIILASYATIMNPTDEETQKFYLHLLLIAVFAAVVAALIALTGIYKIF